MKRVLVTGANGFIGRRLCPILEQNGFTVRRAFRQLQSDQTENSIVVGDINGKTDWASALEDVDVVIHLAARVHIMNDNANEPLLAYREVNVDGTKQLATTAAQMGIQHFVYLSSIKVNGESTTSDRPFTETDEVNPQDPYSISKWEAEQCLHEIGARSPMGITIIRPCLVYGPEVKANFLTMMRWVTKGIPLPLGKTNNQRSFIYVDNLANLILNSLYNKEAIGETFIASDGENPSTSELLRCLATAMGKPARLLPIPQSLMRLGLKVLGHSDIGDRLFGSLVVDISKARRLLNWNPPFTLDEGVRETVVWYLNGER